MKGLKIGRDRNGNKVLRVKLQGGRGFSVQTNGNLPLTHCNGVCSATQEELAQYIKEHGTDRQKELIK